MTIEERLTHAGQAFRSEPISVPDLSTVALTDLNSPPVEDPAPIEDPGPVETIDPDPSDPAWNGGARTRHRILLPVIASLAAAAVIIGAVIVTTRNHNPADTSHTSPVTGPSTSVPPTDTAVPATISGLISQSWELAQVLGSSDTTITSGRAPRLSFDGPTRLAFDNGCNSKGGPVRISATTLTTTGVSSTLQLCPTVAGVDTVLGIPGTITWRITNNQLHLTRAGTELVYAPEP